MAEPADWDGDLERVHVCEVSSSSSRVMTLGRFTLSVTPPSIPGVQPPHHPKLGQVGAPHQRAAVLIQPVDLAAIALEATAPASQYSRWSDFALQADQSALHMIVEDAHVRALSHCTAVRCFGRPTSDSSDLYDEQHVHLGWHFSNAKPAFASCTAFDVILRGSCWRRSR